MKKAILALLVGLMVPVCMAGTVVVHDGPGSPGGLFNVVTSNNGSFQTFCLERTEYLQFDKQYYYEISTAARFNNVTGGLDPISLATAWLFKNFKNTAGYVNDAAHNDAIQQAIWWLEGETDGVKNSYADMAIAAITAMGKNWNDDANGAFGVYVMNINTTPDQNNFSGRVQDLLICVPDGGATVMLLGIGLGGLALVSRKLRS